MRMLNDFPEHRRHDPTRRAEMQVYDQLAGSGSPGVAIYEVKVNRVAPEVDFVAWFQDVARFGIQVKGGRYAMEGSRWFLYTNGEREAMQDPVKMTWDAAMRIRTALLTRGNYKVYMIAVLVFPDMLAPDPEIDQWANNCRVNVVWGCADLVNRLMEIRDVEGIYSPPTARHIEAEVEVLMPGLAEDLPGAAAEGPLMPDLPAMGLTARQVVIQHAEVVNVYTVGAADAGLGATLADGEQS